MKRVFTIFAVALIVASCYKSKMEDPTPTPPKEEVTVDIEIVLPTIDPGTGDPSNPDTTTPESYTAIMDGETVEFSTDKDGTIKFTKEHAPGEYTMYVYSNSSDLEMSDNINDSGEGTIVSSAVVSNTSLTEDLYFGTQTITILDNEVVSSTVDLELITRIIKFNFKITKGDPSSIKSVTASLSGIAQQWECISDAPHGDAATIKPEFTQGESLTKADVENDYLSSTIKVLGINGDEQILTLKITFNDDTSNEIEIPISEKLLGSNSSKSTPIIIEDDLDISGTEADTSGSIDDWTGGAGGSETVN